MWLHAFRVARKHRHCWCACQSSHSCGAVSSRSISRKCLPQQLATDSFSEPRVCGCKGAFSARPSGQIAWKHFAGGLERSIKQLCWTSGVCSTVAGGRSFYSELTTVDPLLFSDNGKSRAWFLNPEALLTLSPRSVASFRCVSDPSSATCPVIAALDVYVRRSTEPLASVTNYLGCIGAPPATRVGDGDESTRGVFYSRSRVRPSDIADGLSKTILVGEVLGDSPEFHAEVIEARHSLLCGGVSTFSFGRAPDRTMSGVAEAVMYRSRHPGAVNLGFVDGSVRAMDVEAAITVVRSLATRAGGESIEPAAY